MPTLNSMAEILQELSRLTHLHQGWQFLPADNPEEASFGRMAFRHVRKDGTPILDGPLGVDAEEECIHYEWLPFGRRLKPEYLVCQTPDEFRTNLAELRRQGAVYSCDDPKKILVGFVMYRPASGSSFVLQMPASLMKNAASTLQTEWLIHQAMRY